MIGGCIKTMGVALLAASAWGANWTEYSSGPFRVVSAAGGKAPRASLIQLDQLRHTLGGYLAKDDLDAVWPIDIVLFANQKEYAPHALPRPLVDGPASILGAWTSDTALPHDLLRAIAKQFIEDNAGRMPPEVEQALVDLVATIQVQAKDNKPMMGAAPSPGELPEDRMRAWAKLQMLATQPEYSSKLRVYLNNLQQGGDELLAARNAFGLTPAELNQRATQYYEAGRFTAVLATGTPINPERDFEDRKLPESDVKELFTALEAAGKDFPPESPRGLMKQRTRDALEQAVKANSRWGAPHDALASLLGDPAAKVKELKLATALEPRNSDYWQDLAIAEEDVFNYAEAEKAWKSAERNAATEADRTRLHKEAVALNDRQAQATIEERKHNQTVQTDDIERVKREAEARIRAAENAANKRAGALTPGVKVVPWWSDDDGVKLSGSLTNVECLSDDMLRLTIQSSSGAAVKVLIEDKRDLAVKGVDKPLNCGIQKPAKPINVVHDGKPDAKQGTAGNVHTVEQP